MKAFLSRHWIAVFLAVLSLYTVVRFGVDQIRPPGFIPNDYVNFHRAADRLNAGTSIYRHEDDSPFKYSPTFLVLFRATFHQLPQPLAWFIWCALSILLFALGTGLLWHWANLQESMRARELAVLITAFTIFGWHGYIEHFSYGQGDFLLFGLFVTAVYFSSRGYKTNGISSALAALCMSILLVGKPQSAILLSYFFVRREWLVLALTAAFTLALLLAPALGWGLPFHLELFTRWKLTLSEQSLDFLTGNLNQNAGAVLARLSGVRALVTPVSTFLVAAGAAFTVLLSARKNLHANSPGLRARLICATLMFYALVTPLSWRWFTFVWIPIGVIAARDAIRGLDSPTTTRLARILLVVFALNGIILQAIVAHALGIREVDDLSYIGAYFLGNVLLFSAIVLSLRSSYKNPNDVSSSISREPLFEDS